MPLCKLPASLKLQLWLASVLLLAMAGGSYYFFVPHRLGRWQGLVPLLQSGQDLLWLVLGWAAMVLLLGLFLWLVPARQMLFTAEIGQLAQKFSYAFLVPLFVVNSFAEELLFRGAMQEWLGLLPAVLLFTLAHLAYYKKPWLLLLVFCLGLVLGLLYQWFGSPWVCGAVHAAYNLFAVWLIKSKRLLALPERRAAETQASADEKAPRA